MGSATYYLKARFASKAAALKAKPKVQAFLEEGGLAYAYWQKHRGAFSENEEPFSWQHFKKKFPLVSKYLGPLFGGDSNNGLAGIISFGGCDVEDALLEHGDELWYSEETWHLADWNPLCRFLETEFGAQATAWVSDEKLDPWDSVNLT